MNENLTVYNNEQELAETKQDDFASKFEIIFNEFPNISEIHKEYIKWKILNHGKTYAEMALHFNRNENYLTQVMNRWDIKACKEKIVSTIDNEVYAVKLSEMKNMSITDDRFDLDELNKMIKEAVSIELKMELIKLKKKITSHYAVVPKEAHTTTQSLNVNVSADMDLPFKVRE